jgi:diacylglycerol kinase family enzyme
MRRAFVVYNPLAGAGRARDVARRAVARLSAAGYEAALRPTRPEGGARAVAREVADEADLLAVAGGDGTLREAIEGLGPARERVHVGLLPFGNANVVAHELAIPVDPDAAIENLVAGAPTAMDLGTIDGGLFLAVVGIGWDALAVKHLEEVRGSAPGRAWYRWWADGVYVLAGMRAFLHVDPPSFRLTVDGERRERPYFGAFVSNVRTYAKGWSVTPGASHASGALDYQGRKRALFPWVAWHLCAAALKKHTPAFISDYGQGTSILLESGEPVPVQVDGDFRGFETRLELGVLRSAVKIVAPLTRSASPAACSA